MIIFLHGPDSYRREEKLRELIATYEEKYRQTDIARFDLGTDPDSWKSVKEFLAQPSMFVSSKVAVIRGGTTVDEKQWIKTIKQALETEGVTLIFSEEKAPLKKFSFLIQRPAQSQEFKELQGNSLESFLKKKTEEEKAAFTSAAWKLMVRGVQNSGENRSWIGARTIEKLSLLAGGREITEEDVETQMSFSRKEQVFRLAGEVLRSRTVGEKLTAIERLFLQRESPSYIFNSLAYQVRGKETIRFADYDIAVKSGAMEYEEVFLDFILKKTGS